MAARRSSNAGLTIIETLMVLAIAGLILSIVFLALPALQRNSRNNQRRQDVQGILAAIGSYKLNHSGSMPNSGDSPNFLQYTTMTNYSNNINYIVNGSGSPNGSGVNIYSMLASTSPASEVNNNIDTVDIYNYRKCSVNSTGHSTNLGAGFRDVVALYSIETAGGKSPECQQL